MQTGSSKEAYPDREKLMISSKIFSHMGYLIFSPFFLYICSHRVWCF